MNPALLARLRPACLFLLLQLVASTALAAQGSLLGVTLTPFPRGGSDAAHAVVVQADGKPIMVGEATTGARQFALTRFNLDGTLDTSYGGSGTGTRLQAPTSGDSAAYAAAVQADGKVIAAGTGRNDLSFFNFALVRFNADGTPDASFGGGGVVTPIGQADSSVTALAIQGDGRVVAGGYSYGATGKQVFTVARYNVDGSLDTTFGNQGVVVFPEGPANEYLTSLVIRADGTIVLAGNASTYAKVARVNQVGAIDATFANGGTATLANLGVNALALQPDGKPVLAGTYNNQFAVARLNLDGALDTAFGNAGISIRVSDSGTQLSASSSGVVVLADGSIVATGHELFNGNNFIVMGRFNAAGTSDTSFGSHRFDFSGLPAGLVARPGGGFYVAGVTVSGGPDSFVTAFTAAGVPDTAFGGSGFQRIDVGTAPSWAFASTMQPDGKVLVAGTNFATNEAPVVRYNTDGSLDTGFGNGGIAHASVGIRNNAIAVQPDGKIVTAGVEISRLNADGSLDTTFGTNGMATIPAGWTLYGLAVQPDGKIVAVGNYNNGSWFSAAILRLLPSGAMDTSFQTGGSEYFVVNTYSEFDAVAVQADGKIVAAGWNGPTQATGQMHVARFNADGTGDTTFNGVFSMIPFGSQPARAAAMAMQPDGRIVVGGKVVNSAGVEDFGLARVTTAGVLDTTFGNNGLVQTHFGDDSEIHALALLADGRIAAAGGTGWLLGLAQYLPNGTLDTSFGTGGLVSQQIARPTEYGAGDVAAGINIGSDGTLYVGATAASSIFALARFSGASDTGTLATPTVAVTSSVNPSSFRELVTFSATVSGASGTPTGTIDFLLDGGRGVIPCGRVTLSGGTAQCITNFVPAGSHTITAAYSGDGTYYAGSSIVAQTVNKVAPSVVVSSSSNPSSLASPVTFTVTVSGPAGTPIGTVSVSDGANAIAGCSSLTLSGTGAATCTTSALAEGSHSITAAYSGDAGYTSASSSALTQTVQRIGMYETNWALATNGGVVSASSQFGAGYPVSAINDGDRKGVNWSNGGGWADGSVGAFPDWVEVDFNGAKQIDAVILYTLQDNWQSPSLPTDTMTFTQYGVTDFTVQGWDGAQWVTLATVGANRNVKRTVAISPFTTTKIRVNITGAQSGLSRITELEAYGVPAPGTTQPVNVARNGTASASSQYGGSYPVSAVIDGDRAGTNWSNGGGWADGTPGEWPDWVEVDFSAPASLTSVVVYTVQDNWQSPVEPWDTMVFTQYGVTDFAVQGWDGSQWVTLGAVSGNNLVKRTVTFNAFVTSKIRVNVTGALASLSRITEVEAYAEPQCTCAVQGETNVALASTGTTVVASGGYSSNYPAEAIIDNERAGAKWSAGGGWADSTLNNFPDWVELHFNGAQTLDKVVVYTVQDDWQHPAEPTDTATFTQYGITDFLVQGWDGTQWVTLGTVTGNNLVKRTVTFAPFTTSIIRVYVTNALAGLSRITEVEAWGAPANPPALTNWAAPSYGAVATASSQYDASYPASAAIDGDTAGTNWSAGGGWADATPSAWPDWLQVTFPGPKTIREITLFTVQDNWQNPILPMNDTMFTQYGITDFEVQGWDGAQWQTLATVSNNRFVKRTVAFPAFSTDRVRVLVTGSLGGLSRITELQAWGN